MCYPWEKMKGRMKENRICEYTWRLRGGRDERIGLMTFPCLEEFVL